MQGKFPVHYAIFPDSSLRVFRKVFSLHTILYTPKLLILEFCSVSFQYLISIIGIDIVSESTVVWGSYSTRGPYDAKY